MSNHTERLRPHNLHAAIKAHNLPLVQKCIEQGVDVNFAYYCDKPPICVAVQERQIGITQALLKAGADPNKYYKRERCNPNDVGACRVRPLDLCVYIDNKKQQIAKLILSSDALLNKDLQMKAALHKAACANNVAFIKVLLNNSVDINGVDKDNEVAMCRACEYGNIEVVQQLLSRGACWYGYRPKAETIEKGSSTQHLTPMFWAVHSSRADIVELLLQHGLEKSESKFFHERLLQNAIFQNEDVGMIKTIVEVGGYPVNGTDEEYDDKTCLHVLAERKPNRGVLKFLWNKGADMYAKDKLGRMPIDCACAFVNPEFIEALLELGLDLKKCDPDNSAKCILATTKNLVGKKMKHYDKIKTTLYLLLAAGAPAPSLDQVKDIEEAILGYKDCTRPGKETISSALGLTAWLRGFLSKPARLTDLCRLQIHQQLRSMLLKGTSVSELIETIPTLSASLKQVLKFEDLVNIDEKIQNSGGVCGFKVLGCWEYKNECTCKLWDKANTSTDEEDSLNDPSSFDDDDDDEDEYTEEKTPGHWGHQSFESDPDKDDKESDDMESDSDSSCNDNYDSSPGDLYEWCPDKSKERAKSPEGTFKINFWIWESDSE